VNFITLDGSSHPVPKYSYGIGVKTGTPPPFRPFNPKSFDIGPTKVLMPDEKRIILFD
jgi:hypothetical protein